MSRRLAIPRALTVKGRRWRVISSKRGPRGLTGECSRDSRTIRIRRRQPRRERELTLAHEWLHAVWPEGVVSDEVEEKIVQRLEGPLRALLLSGQIVAVPEEAT